MLIQNKNLYQSSQNTIFQILILFFIVTLPINIQLNGLSVILLLVFSLLDVSFYSKIKTILQSKGFFLLLFYFVLHLLCASYTIHFQGAVSEVEHKLSYLVFPLVFLHADKFDKSFIQKLYLFFSFYVLFYVVFSILMYMSKVQSFDIHLINRDILLECTEIHPTYLSIYILLSIFFIIIHLFENRNKHNYLLVIFQIISLPILGYIFWKTEARMSIIILPIVFISLIIRYLLMKKRYFFLIVALVIAIIGGIFLQQYLLKNVPRFREITETKLAPPVGIHHNSTNLRVGIFLCTKEVIENNWLLGVGTGSSQVALDACYASKPWSDVLYKIHYQAHNQYLQSYLEQGLIGFVVVLTMLAYFIYKAFKNNDLYMIVFSISIAIICVTESFLSNQKGIVLFAFFYCLFFSSQKKQPNKS